MRKSLCLIAATVIFSLSLVVHSVQAQSNNVVAGFSPTQNPGGVWSYGYKPSGGSFTNLTNNNDIFGLGSGMSTWYWPNAGWNLPAVFHNGTGAAKTYLTYITQPTDVLNLHPGPNGEKVVVRWTAPAAGTYAVAGRFEGLDSRGTTTDVSITHNSAAVYNGSVIGHGNLAVFSLTRTVAAGDTIEFLVGYGGDGTVTGDSTGLAADIVLQDGGAVLSGEQMPDPPAPTNVPSVFTRVVGTDVYRGSVGGLRNVGQGTITVAGVAGTVTKAYLFWHGVTNFTDPFSVSSMTFNGFLISGTPIGTSGDNGWLYNVSQGYRADVTNLVAFNPNRLYLLSNFGSGNLNPNGATLIIFFNDNNLVNDWDVTVVNGNDSNWASNYDGNGWGAFFPQVYKYGNQRVSLDLIVADGQSFADAPLFINGSYIATAGNHFQGNTVRSTNNGPHNNGNLWDFTEYEVGHLLAPGYNNFSFSHGTPVETFYSDKTSLIAVIYYARIDQQKVYITNPRVSGDLTNTTQNALLGADVILQANPYPEGLTGGSFSWTATGPHQIVSGPNSNVFNVRWTEPGTHSATVRYVRNGITLTGTINVNVVVPALSQFSATANAPDQINRGLSNCAHGGPGTTSYSLGCGAGNGIVFNATAQIPSVPYLTDPAQAGVGFFQVVSEYRRYKTDVRKETFIGNLIHYWYDGRDECMTARASESNVDSGWQWDSQGFSFARFNQGNSLPISGFDSPAQILEKRNGSLDMNQMGVDQMHSVFYGPSSFETYVYYYVGADFNNPIMRRPLGLASDSNFRFHRIPWTWRGQAYFDRPNSPSSFYVLQFTTTTQGTILPTGTNVERAYNGSVHANTFRPCPDTAPPTNNVIDGTRFFVRELYRRVLGRNPEEIGWDEWTSVIARCGFDTNCINSKRVTTARGFLESGELFSQNPLLASPGSQTYNKEYVRLCYFYFLGRNPGGGEDQGWVDYINSHPGDYDTLVWGFIFAPEFRDDFPQP